MAEDASIAHELYKIRNKWDSIDKKKWDMAIWVCDYQDVEILDKFMDIEASPIGVFDDIFFRFQAVFTEDEVFELHLWREFLSWFHNEDKSYDLIDAFKKDGFLPEDYKVNDQLPPTFDSIMSELLRLKKLLPLEEESFILYFIPALHENGFEKWFHKKLAAGLPEGIRLAALDIDAKRLFPKLRKHKRATVVELRPTLDMGNAMRNEMNKDSDSNRPHTPSAKFQKQVRKVMDATVDEELDIHEEAERLIFLGYQLDLLNTKATSHLICATAFFSKKLNEEAMEQANKAIDLAEPEIGQSDDGYPIWRSSIMIKASLYLVHKTKKQEAINCYMALAKEATRQGDPFYAMEAYRMMAFIHFQAKRLKEAWEDVMFSLQAGTNLPLDVRRGSTFLYSAALAKQISKDKYEPQETINMLHKRFETLIGEDWEELLQGTDTLNMKYMNRKKPLKV